MQRRDCLLAGLGLGLASASDALAQAAPRLVRVGVLRPTAPPVSLQDPTYAGFPNALSELGYREGHNLVVERRWAGGDPARLPALAQELVQAKVDVIIAVALPSIRAALDATSTIPIVLYGNFDPVALGLVRSLARPGGNITGVLIAPDGTLAAKKLELLKAAVPGQTRFAYMTRPDDASAQQQVQEVQAAAAQLGVELLIFKVQDKQYSATFEAMAARRPAGLFVGAHTYFVRDRHEIIALAAKHRLPAIYEWREQVEDGGLMAYGTSMRWTYQRVAAQIDRIVKGTPVGELPVERPSTFGFVINAKTAKALKLTIPQSLLLRADEVIT